MCVYTWKLTMIHYVWGVSACECVCMCVYVCVCVCVCV